MQWVRCTLMIQSRSSRVRLSLVRPFSRFGVRTITGTCPGAEKLFTTIETTRAVARFPLLFVEWKMQKRLLTEKCFARTFFLVIVVWLGMFPLRNGRANKWVGYIAEAEDGFPYAWRILTSITVRTVPRWHLHQTSITNSQLPASFKLDIDPREYLDRLNIQCLLCQLY